jgi:hypothetical protein
MKCVGELYGGANVLLVGLWDYFSGGVDGRCYCLSGSSMVSLLYRKTVLDGSLGNEDVGIRRAHVEHPRDLHVSRACPYMTGQFSGQYSHMTVQPSTPPQLSVGCKKLSTF